MLFIAVESDNNQYLVNCENKKCGIVKNNIPTEKSAISFAYLHRYIAHWRKAWKSIAKRYVVIVRENLNVTPESMGA